MPKTYTEGHKAREITLAEAAIVKLREAETKAVVRYEGEKVKAVALRLRAKATENKSLAVLRGGDHDRKIEAAEAHLAWLRAMPVPTEAAPDAAQ